MSNGQDVILVAQESYAHPARQARVASINASSRPKHGGTCCWSWLSLIIQCRSASETSKDRNRHKRPFPCHWIAIQFAYPSIDPRYMHRKTSPATVERHQPQYVMSSFSPGPRFRRIVVCTNQDPHGTPAVPAILMTSVMWRPAGTWGSRVGGAPKPCVLTWNSRTPARDSLPRLSRAQSKVRAKCVVPITLCKVTRVPGVYRTPSAHSPAPAWQDGVATNASEARGTQLQFIVAGMMMWCVSNLPESTRRGQEKGFDLGSCGSPRV